MVRIINAIVIVDVVSGGGVDILYFSNKKAAMLNGSINVNVVDFVIASKTII